MRRSLRHVLVCAALAGMAGCQPGGQPPLGTPGAPARPARPTAQRVLVFSDLHFNPFADTTLVDSLAQADVARWRAIFNRFAPRGYSGYGSDTNYPLLESAIAAMQNAAPDAELILIAGDFLAHGFQRLYQQSARDTSAAGLASFTDKTNRFLALQVALAFPDAQVLPALGNNDSVCGDYLSEPRSPFLRSFAAAWAPLVDRRGSAPDFLTSFPSAGHYVANVPSLPIRVVVLNDVYWSARYRNACGSTQDDPGAEAMGWLNRVLADSRSRGERVWLLSHIPLGVDVFATLRADSVVTMLAPAYAAQLSSTLQGFAGTIRYGLYGHTHMTEFRLAGDGTAGTVGSQGFPAISPIFGNNPAFAVLSVDADGGIVDYTMFALPNPAAAAPAASGAWPREYGFVEAYGAGDLRQSLVRLHGVLPTDSTARGRFIRYYDSGSGRAGITPASWRAYWCGIASFDAASFSRCRASSAP